MFPGHQRTAIIRADGLKRLRKEVVMVMVVDGGCSGRRLLVLRLHSERWRGRRIHVTIFDAHPVTRIQRGRRQQLEGKNSMPSRTNKEKE